MKKFLLLAIVMVFASGAFAQMSSGGFALDHSRVYYGVRIGASFSNLDFYKVDLNTKVGLTLAAIVGLRVSDSVPVFLESGFYYNGRGARKKDLKVNLNYLELPILIKYGIRVSDPVTIIPFVGPYFGIAVSGKASGKFGELEVDGSPFIDGGIKRGDMGFKFGAGVEYNMLYLELGYQIGVADIGKNPNETRTNSFFANFGVNF